MKSDGGILRYLLNKRRGEPNGTNPFAFGFDGVNDYISSNATIGRTGYDMNVSGNVSRGSDADGEYIWFNGNRDASVPSGTAASVVQGTGVSLNQTAGFTIAAKFKAGGVVPSSGSLGVYGSSNIISLYLVNTAGVNVLTFRIRNGGTFTDVTFNTVVNTAYTAHGVYDSTTNKMYLYVNGVLQNVGGTSVAAATFGGSQVFYFGDLGVGGGNVKSASLNGYFACTWNRALSQSDITADIALGNTTKQDPSIVAYYVPENLQFNTQYLTNPTALDQSNWIKTGTTSVTANTTVAPDGTTTADTVTIAGTATQGCNTVVTSITGATIASKTFIVKAFVKVSAGTDQFRLQCSHNGVADYYSSNLTATTDRQEFTFTQTFTSSTSGTGITAGLVNDSGAGGATIEVRNVRVFLTNETLRDESPNIGGFIGRKAQKVLSCRYKPNADFADASDAGCLISQPRAYLQDRGPLHNATMRYDNRIGARTSFISLGSLYRSKTHILGLQYRTGSARATKLYINGTLLDSDNHSVDAPTGSVNTVMRNGRKGSTYFSGNIRDVRIYTFTGSFTDADALAIYNGGEPTSAGVTKHLHYRPPVGEVGTTTQDQSSNDRDGTLNGGVTRIYL